LKLHVELYIKRNNFLIFFGDIMKIMGVDVGKAIISAMIFWVVFVALSSAVKAILPGEQDLM